MIRRLGLGIKLWNHLQPVFRGPAGLMPAPHPPEGCLGEVAVSLMGAGSPRLPYAQDTALELQGDPAALGRELQGPQALTQEPLLCALSEGPPP